VSMLQSNFTGWGSMLFVRDLGIVLHNRGALFSLASGHPAEYRPGRRPPHTLAPALVTRVDGSVEATLATRGGEIQPHILLQLLARVLGAGESAGAAMAAPRWALAGGEVMVEGHAPERWLRDLRRRGERVVQRPQFSEDFGHAQLIVAADGYLAAASDPRSPGWAAAVV